MQTLVKSLNVPIPKINVQVPYTEDDLTRLAFFKSTKLFLTAYPENNLRVRKFLEAFFFYSLLSIIYGVILINPNTEAQV